MGEGERGVEGKGEPREGEGGVKGRGKSRGRDGEGEGRARETSGGGEGRGGEGEEEGWRTEGRGGYGRRGDARHTSTAKGLKTTDSTWYKTVHEANASDVCHYSDFVD